MENKDVFSLITSEENSYKKPVSVIDGYEWSMYQHIKLTTLYKNSQLSSGKDDDKPVKNIILPMLRLQYMTEGFDVKDVELYVNDAKDYYKSMLIRKFHEKWAREVGLDTFIDELVESYVDYGGALVKVIDSPRPEVVPLPSIAFCDQTDLLGGPIGIKHPYAPDQLLEMKAKGWGNFGTTLEDLIQSANSHKNDPQNSTKGAKTPGKYIEVYEVHGMFPNSWLEDESTETSDDAEDTPEEIAYTRQVHIVAFKDGDNDQDKCGVTLFRGRLPENPFRLILRDKIYGRALGLGGAEELFEAQVWTTYDQIRIKGMLDAASKVIYKTTDAGVAQRHPNGLQDLENGDIVQMDSGDLSQIDTRPINLEVFETNLSRWNEHAQTMAGASDALMGETPPTNTPFKLQQLLVAQGQGIHDYRRGKLAVFMDELYREVIIPYLVKEITKGQEFLSDFSMQELQYIADALSVNVSNDTLINMVIAGEEVTPDTLELLKSVARDQFMKGGTKKFVQVLADDMKDAPIDVETNIYNKQKNLSSVVDNLTNIFRQIIAAPGALDDPRMAAVFNQILEASGLDPIDTYAKAPAPQPAPQQAAPAPEAPAPTPVPTG